MASTSMPSGARRLIGAEEILAPSPGALLRRRIFRHWGLMIGGAILIVIVADGAAGAAAVAATTPTTSNSRAS